MPHWRVSEGGTFRKRKVTFGVINTKHYFRFAKGSLAEDGRQVVAKGVLQEVGFCRQRRKSVPELAVSQQSLE